MKMGIWEFLKFCKKAERWKRVKELEENPLEVEELQEKINKWGLFYIYHYFTKLLGEGIGVRVDGKEYYLKLVEVSENKTKDGEK